MHASRRKGLPLVRLACKVTPFCLGTQFIVFMACIVTDTGFEVRLPHCTEIPSQEISHSLSSKRNLLPKKSRSMLQVANVPRMRQGNSNPIFLVFPRVASLSALNPCDLAQSTPESSTNTCVTHRSITTQYACDLDLSSSAKLKSDGAVGHPT